MTNNNRQKGVSLIEILVVVAIFAFVGILITRTIAISLQGAQKSTSLVHAQENLNYAMSVIERQIRNANSISSCSTTPTNTLSYIDQSGNSAYFDCENIGNVSSYIASGSATLTSNLTSNTVKITSCSFTCAASNPPVVTVNLAVQDISSSGIEGGSAASTIQVSLMNY